MPFLRHKKSNFSNAFLYSLSYLMGRGNIRKCFLKQQGANNRIVHVLFV